MGRPQKTDDHTSSRLQTIPGHAHGISISTTSDTPGSPRTKEEDNAPPIEPNLQPIERDQNDPQIDRHQPPRTDAAPDA